MRGHLSANCTNPPTAKRSRALDSADVVFDMSPGANDFARWGPQRQSVVVDDAVVVGENIYHKKEEGKDGEEGAIEGATEVAIPVTFSILTNIVAFSPLYFVPGRIGKIFQKNIRCNIDAKSN